jgi:4-hydroxy-tetrahydrodipicolinate synthase
MANFHPQLYAYLCDHIQEAESDDLMAFLSIASLIERQYYPVNAKYYLQTYASLPVTTYSRRQEKAGLTETFCMEVDMLHRLETIAKEKLGLA